MNDGEGGEHAYAEFAQPTEPTIFTQSPPHPTGELVLAGNNLPAKSSPFDRTQVPRKLPGQTKNHIFAPHTSKVWKAEMRLWPSGSGMSPSLPPTMAWL
jgi:hypothetical protein